MFKYIKELIKYFLSILFEIVYVSEEDEKYYKNNKEKEDENLED